MALVLFIGKVSPEFALQLLARLDNLTPSLRQRACGKLGEYKAAQFLKSQNHEVLARNLRIGGIELDLLLLDLSTKSIVAVEVKTRVESKLSQSEMFISINSDKERRLRRACEIFVSKRKLNIPFRIDLVGINLERETFRVLNIKHLQGAC